MAPWCTGCPWGLSGAPEECLPVSGRRSSWSAVAGRVSRRPAAPAYTAPVPPHGPPAGA